jgi:hypothetical protein
MRQNTGALRPALLSAILTCSATRGLTLAPRNSTSILLTYSAITAVVYVLACIFSDPDCVLVDMWARSSLLPALAGSISASFISAAVWQGGISIWFLVFGGTAYLGLFVLWVSAIRTVTARGF